MTRKRLGCIIAPVVIILFLAVYMLILNPQCCHDCMVCESNLMRLHFALERYAENHGGRYPERLEELHPKYVDLGKLRCPRRPASRGTLDTGYEYIAGAAKDDEGNRPVLFCSRYHLNGHGPGPYEVLFCVLTKGGAVVHVESDDIRKYTGPMRRYFLYFRRYPYDGSVPQLETVRALEHEFPKDYTGRWVRVSEDAAGKAGLQPEVHAPAGGAGE
ncbi:MAG: hypothetical protein JW889_07210 [Verrucomicrobia bacterium]|nr:hypothetical protein [Verrucomicrobiota bacterium]